MAEPKKPLNLDELFGQARAVIVIKDDVRHELIRLEALDPKQAVRFQKLQVKASGLKSIDPQSPSDAQAQQVTEAVDEMLSILCDSMPLDKLSFVEKTRVLEYYFEEIQEKKAPKLALAKVRSKQTGARPSRR